MESRQAHNWASTAPPVRTVQEVRHSHRVHGNPPSQDLVEDNITQRAHPPAESVPAAHQPTQEAAAWDASPPGVPVGHDAAAATAAAGDAPRSGIPTGENAVADWNTPPPGVPVGDGAAAAENAPPPGIPAGDNAATDWNTPPPGVPVGDGADAGDAPPPGVPAGDNAAAHFNTPPPGVPVGDAAAAAEDASPPGVPARDNAAPIWDTAPPGVPAGNSAAPAWNVPPPGIPIEDTAGAPPPGVPELPTARLKEDVQFTAARDEQIRALRRDHPRLTWRELALRLGIDEADADQVQQHWEKLQNTIGADANVEQGHVDAFQPPEMVGSWPRDPSDAGDGKQAPNHNDAGANPIHHIPEPPTEPAADDPQNVEAATPELDILTHLAHVTHPANVEARELTAAEQTMLDDLPPAQVELIRNLARLEIETIVDRVAAGFNAQWRRGDMTRRAVRSVLARCADGPVAGEGGPEAGGENAGQTGDARQRQNEPQGGQDDEGNHGNNNGWAAGDAAAAW